MVAPFCLCSTFNAVKKTAAYNPHDRLTRLFRLKLFFQHRMELHSLKGAKKVHAFCNRSDFPFSAGCAFKKCIFRGRFVRAVEAIKLERVILHILLFVGILGKWFLCQAKLQRRRTVSSATFFGIFESWRWVVMLKMSRFRNAALRQVPSCSPLFHISIFVQF